MNTLIRYRFLFVFIFLIIFRSGVVFSQSKGTEPNIAFLSSAGYNESNAETRAAFDFLKSIDQHAAFLTVHEISSRPSVITKYNVIWYHKPDTLPFPAELMKKKVLDQIRIYTESGKSLLLTLDAIRLLVPLGLEAIMPADSLKSCIDEGYGRKLGLHAFLAHPVFDSLFGGAYILRPEKDSVFRITGYFGNTVPHGKVIAVDWDYIFLRESTKLMMEYNTGKGRVIAIGAYTCFSTPNYNRAHLELFMRNIFRYLKNPSNSGEIHYWDYEKNKVTSFQLSGSLRNSVPSNEKSKSWDIPDDPMTLKRQFGSDDFFDVAGERMLTMGSEQGGIEEIWSHPFMALRDYAVGIRFGYKDTIYWLNDQRPEIEVRPEAFTRTYRFPRAYLKEVITDDPVNPSGVIHYEYNGVYEAQIVVKFSTRLRLMWPYPETVTGAINFSADSAGNFILFTDKSGRMCVVIGGNKPPIQCMAGQYSDFIYDRQGKHFKGIQTDDFMASGVLEYSLNMTDDLDIVYAATDQGLDTTFKEYQKTIKDPYSIYLRSASHVHKILDENLIITSPDPDFNLGYRWALVATDRFFVNTPGMGKSLVAGYSTTRKGWDGSQKISGRPGYGWYFGRDGQWSGMALLDYGDFEKVKDELEFYMKYQDLSGKIFHEATTSGVIHYDASDATPLFIVLAGRYFRHTNDTAFLRKSWPAMKCAIDFCFSTDTDHDHLIENTNVGHGWVEGGELYGSHATLYMQGCWSAALEEASMMAKALFLPVSEYYESESAIVKRMINTDFWDNESQFFTYGMNKNGTFRKEPTVLPAVPLYFKTSPREKADKVLEQYAGNAFSTNWGTRIVRDDSRLFNPRGYHYGSVWPLFTGWSSLAEYAYGNYVQGFSHLMDNLDIYKSWGLGFAEEVLNGAEYRPSGVCPHQCWSETMILQPAIEGLIGLDVNEHEKKVTLAPHLPASWDSVFIENIRSGEKKFDMKMKRTSGKYIFEFISRTPGRINVEFFPSFPPGTTFSIMTLNGITLPFSSIRDQKASAILTTVPLEGNAKIEMSNSDGICIIPEINDPKPGYPAAGARIISAGLAGNTYFIKAENLPGSSSDFKVYCHGFKPVRIVNGTIKDATGDYMNIHVDFEPSSKKYLQKTVYIDLSR